ncbi:MAG: protease HtpX [Elusimicrobia bacterium]|nr:protease HtpX [Elusimicrobiota bacterium]
MSTIKRIFLFVAVNLLVILAISIVIQIVGVEPYLTRGGINYRALLTFCAIFGFVGSFISLQLSRFMAKHALGVVLIDPQAPGGAAESRLVETVTRICQRAGLNPLPEIGIYPSREVNAFATGPSRSRSLVAVSSGLLDRMDDKAVEGVLAHEVSHIVNGDMVTMTLLQGVANTFVMFAARVAVFAIDSFLRSRDDEGKGLGYFAQYLLIMLFETALMLLAMIVVYYFSRRREFAADNGSAELAGRETMIHALESLQDHKDAVDRSQPSLATLKIHGGARGMVALLFSSHPPIEARIAALRNQEPLQRLTP